MQSRTWTTGSAAAGLLLLAGLACAAAMTEEDAGGAQATPVPEGAEIATFAGGCFWCMESPFEGLDGVLSVTSGYTGGSVENPTYDQVSSGRTGHAEAVQVVYDPSRISYAELLQTFWRQIDPTDPGGQFADRGSQYRTAVFVHDEAQREAAERSVQALAASGRFSGPIVTAILDARRFWPAEPYHQDYYKKNATHYKAYRRGSGREDYLHSVWSPDEE